MVMHALEMVFVSIGRALVIADSRDSTAVFWSVMQSAVVMDIAAMEHAIVDKTGVVMPATFLFAQITATIMVNVSVESVTAVLDTLARIALFVRAQITAMGLVAVIPILLAIARLVGPDLIVL